MKIKTIIVILVMLTLVIGITWFLRSKGVTINEDIPSDKMTVKGLIEVAKPFVDKYWGNRNYYVGKNSMELDKNLEGKVDIWYKDDRKNRKGVPNIITVEFDTKERKILRIINQERNTRIEPHILNIDEWNIDSDEAIEIAKDTFGDLDDFDFTFAYISVDKVFIETKEKWSVMLFNEESKRSYHLEIDVYTGEIYHKEIK